MILTTQPQEYSFLHKTDKGYLDQHGDIEVMTQEVIDFEKEDDLVIAFKASQKDLQCGLIELSNLISEPNVPEREIYSTWCRHLRSKYDLDSNRITWIWQTLRTDSQLRTSSKFKDSIFRFRDTKALNRETWLILVLQKDSNKSLRPF